MAVSLDSDKPERRCIQQREERSQPPPVTQVDDTMVGFLWFPCCVVTLSFASIHADD